MDDRTLPAQRITTALAWDDLVLDTQTREQVATIARWVRHSKSLLEDWGLGRHVRHGFHSLFYGPPGTGKTLAVCLIGRDTGLTVYRVDLGRIATSAPGETERMLDTLFHQAERDGAILYLDEAEALFGKRTEVRDAHDRYANQQTAYLLQRLEAYPGVAILATNLRSHIDNAFVRRFESVIHFAMPGAAERLALWTRIFHSRYFRLGDTVDLHRIAADYELSGGDIANVFRFAALWAADGRHSVIEANELLAIIRQEIAKTGRPAL